MCIHNQRTRYSNGYFCDDCNTFFSKDSPTYRQTELLSSVWMVLWNINAERLRAGLDKINDVSELADKIGLGKLHNNYEELISKAETLMVKHGKNSDSATLILPYQLEK